MNTIKRILLLALVLATRAALAQQEIDLENAPSRILTNLKKNPFRFSGGAEARGVYETLGNGTPERYTYFVNGTLNVSVYNFTLPLSYALTNQGNQLGYAVPFKFNRLSIAPKYKGWQVFAGDSNHTLSHYTLSGLLITGGAVKYEGKGNWHGTLLAGRTRKAVPYTAVEGAPEPSLAQWGYGGMAKHKGERATTTLALYYARDKSTTAPPLPDAPPLVPQENLLLEAGTEFKLTQHITLMGQYASSAYTPDATAGGAGGSRGLLRPLYKGNASTVQASAYHFGSSLKIGKGNLGLRYERVAPEYVSLGAYYVNSDFENMVLEGSLPFWGKYNLKANLGRQRNNLNNAKAQENQRWVGSASLEAKLSERLAANATYSNFTSYTNAKRNRFDAINQNPLLNTQAIDTLNYKRIDQNADINLTYQLSKESENKQSLILAYNVNQSTSKEDGVAQKAQASEFHNASLSHNINIAKHKMQVTSSFAFTHTQVEEVNSLFYGPTLVVKRPFYNDKLNCSLNLTYNTNQSPLNKVDFFNSLLKVSYALTKKQALSLQSNASLRRIEQNGEQKKNNQYLVSLQYNYKF